jgi:hypothetical protein
MANELTLNVSLTFTKNQIAPVTINSKSFPITVNGNDYVRGVESATLTQKALTLTEDGIPGYCIVHNLDTTGLVSHFILFGSNFGQSGGNGIPLLQLGPNEWALFRFNPSSFPWIQMNPTLTATGDPTSIQLEYMIVSA